MASQEETSPPIAVSAAQDQAGSGTAPAATPSVPLPPVIGGKYRPLRLIARGGMGAVYEVVHLNTGEHLALKLMLARSLLAPELVERFRREARVHSSVKSDHVVRVVDADVAPELDDAPFLVMELLAGKDLERLCVERDPSPAEVIDWMRQLAPALDRAHREGIVHRDLKPENLFLAEREGLPPIVKILDFGIAKMGTEGAGHSTATGQILGTPRYMAPEQAVGAKAISAAADRFALGLIGFRLLCRRHYFSGDNWVVLLREVARGPVARPSEIGCDRGRAFDAWFARACAFDPRDRFATSVDQVEALAQALEGGPKTVSRWRAARPWAALAAAGALAVVVWGLERRRNTSPPRATSGSLAQTSAATRAPEPMALVPPPPPVAESKHLGPEIEDSDPPAAASATHRQKRRLTRTDARVAKNRPSNEEPARDRVWDEP